MLDYLAERKFIIISMLVILSFFGLTLSSGSSSSLSGVVDYKKIDTSSSMYRGNNKAGVSVIQYSDFLCPSCSLFSTQIMPEIDKDYIATDKVNFEFRPMAFIADGSFQAGMGGYCAVDQNKFWPYHDAIYSYVANDVFGNGKDPKTDIILTAGVVKMIAGQAGLDSTLFDDCLDSKKHLTDINKSTAAANKNGVNSTPYILVNGQVYNGSMTSAPFKVLIETKL